MAGITSRVQDGMFVRIGGMCAPAILTGSRTDQRVCPDRGVMSMEKVANTNRAVPGISPRATAS